MSDAVRCRKRGSSQGMHTTHRLADEDRTFCGKAVADLLEPEPVALADVRKHEECRQCLRVVDHVKYTRTVSPIPAEREPRFTSPPMPGRLRTTGPLYHGVRSGRSRGIR